MSAIRPARNLFSENLDGDGLTLRAGSPRTLAVSSPKTIALRDCVAISCGPRLSWDCVTGRVGSVSPDAPRNF
jgi:hypothetical protein